MCYIRWQSLRKFTTVDLHSTSDIWTSMKDKDTNSRAEVSESFNGIISELPASIHVYLLDRHNSTHCHACRSIIQQHTTSFNGRSSRSTMWVSQHQISWYYTSSHCLHFHRHYYTVHLLSVSSIFYSLVHKMCANANTLNYCQQLPSKSS